jgi:hypothetical protein
LVENILEAKAALPVPLALEKHPRRFLEVACRAARTWTKATYLSPTTRSIASETPLLLLGCVEPLR